MILFIVILSVAMLWLHNENTKPIRKIKKCTKKPLEDCPYIVTYYNGSIKAEGHFQCCKTMDQLKDMNAAFCEMIPNKTYGDISISKEFHDQALKQKEYYENLDTTGPRKWIINQNCYNFLIIDVSLDENGMYHETSESYLGSIFRFCDCGSPEIVLKYVYTALNNIKIKHDIGSKNSRFLPTITPEYAKVCDNERNFYNSEAESYFVLYRLDDMEYLEHGSSIDGNWLTEKGYDILEALEECLNG